MRQDACSPHHSKDSPQNTAVLAGHGGMLTYADGLPGSTITPQKTLSPILDCICTDPLITMRARHQRSEKSGHSDGCWVLDVVTVSCR